MNRATIPTGWVRNPVMTSPDLDPGLARSYELGWTYNPFTGCLNHTPEGLCLGGMFPCYAYKLANGRLRERYLANTNTAPRFYGEQFVEDILVMDDPFYPRFWQGRLLDARDELCNAKPRGIFVCDMSDLFGIGIPEEWTKRVLGLIRMNPSHRFYLLTKQPQNLIKFSPFPDNCRVGVTVTKPGFLFPALDALDSIQCSVRYLSIEPMLAGFDVPDLSLLFEGSVDWLILGSQTKPYKPPKIEWVEEIVRACDKAGIPVFLKDNLFPLVNSVDMVDYRNLWSGGKQNKLDFPLRLRQEIPS